MPIKDMLLPLLGGPSAGAIAAIEKCVHVAANLDAEIAALAIEEDITVRPVVVAPVERERPDEVRSTTDARGLLKAFDAIAARIGIRNVQSVAHLTPKEIPEHLARCARLKDLSIVPVEPDDDRAEKILKGLIFQSGRPILLCPEEFAAGLPVNFDRVVVAWDQSAPAARAIGDALPLLRRARDVQIVTATNGDTSAERDSGAAVIRHLAEHGIKASFDLVRIDGSSVGKVLAAEAKARGGDLMVMGAYGHSRLSEWVWGGATKTIIAEPPGWVIMSH
jgi:nucleotide-binding universal stress UspA family protein